VPRKSKRRLTHSSKKDPEISELVTTFNPREILPGSSNGLNILSSKDKKEFF
jgi:hypothetical protein